jgi:hypothetical protein
MKFGQIFPPCGDQATRGGAGKMGNQNGCWKAFVVIKKIKVIFIVYVQIAKVLIARTWHPGTVDLKILIHYLV